MGGRHFLPASASILKGSFGTNITMADATQLISLARGGDKDALGQLLEPYRSYLRLLARLQIGRRLQGKLDACDLVQETFLRAHHRFSQFQGTTDEELIAWLRQILASSLATVIRHYFGAQRRDLHLERELTVELDQSSRILAQGLIGQQSSPSQQASRREQSLLLAEKLERLPPDYREVVILRHLQGLSFADVAREMGKTVDSVKKLWARALARLRDLLENHHEAAHDRD